MQLHTDMHIIAWKYTANGRSGGGSYESKRKALSPDALTRRGSGRNRLRPTPLLFLDLRVESRDISASLSWCDPPFTASAYETVFIQACVKHDGGERKRGDMWVLSGCRAVKVGQNLSSGQQCRQCMHCDLHCELQTSCFDFEGDYENA